MRRWLLLVLLSCGPSSRLDTPARPITFDVDDPRCAPQPGVYQPTLSLIADGGIPDAGLLAWERVEVRVDGLPPCRLLDMVFGQAVGGFSYAVFQADFDGVVSTARAPLRGSWTGADIDGPVSTSEGGRFVQNINVLADWGIGPYLEATWPRRDNSFGVDVLPIRGARGVFGDLYLPATRGPWPCVIIIGGTEGGVLLTQQVARTFVERGYLALALSYVGVDGLPTSIDSVRLEYFLEAIEVITEYPGARRDRVALIGLSRGAEAALLVGTMSPKVTAVVSVVGSGVVFPAEDNWSSPAWTTIDSGVPFIPWANVAPVSTALSDGGVELTLRDSFAQSVTRADAGAIEAATIAVERINGPVLLLAAADDQRWPSCALSSLAWDRLVDAGHSTRHPLDGLECYPRAGHGSNPGFVGLPLLETLVFARPDGGVLERFGGTAQGNGNATRAMWERTNQFLEAAFR